MKDAHIARQILEAIEVLNDLLWDRFGDQITQIYREEQQKQPEWQDHSDSLDNDPGNTIKDAP